MYKASEIKPSEHIVALILGRPKTGKTSLIASFASKEEPMYVFDIDHRAEGLAGSKKWLKDSLPYIDVEQYDTRDGFKAIEDQFMIFSNDYDKRQLKYKNIVIDSVGSLSHMLLIDSKALKGLKPGTDLTAKGVDKKGYRIVGNVAFSGPDDYNYSSQVFHSMFYHWFTAFPKCNIFVSGWTTDRWEKDRDPKTDVILPYAPNVVTGRQLMATNKLASEIPGCFNEIWEIEKRETGSENIPLKYVVHFRSDIASTCIAELPNSIDITSKNFKEEMLKELIKNRAKDEESSNITKIS